MEEVLPELNTLPFFMNLRSPLTNSSAVIIKGYAPENATTFSIKFGTPIACCFCRNTDERDAAFSLRPYFDRRYIVRNSTHKLKWQEEETAGSQDFPLFRASNFSIEIFIADRDLLIAINGIHYCTFTLKKAISSITSIEIEGDIKLESVDINPDQDVYPSTPTPEVQPTNTGHIIDVDSDTINCRDLKLPIVCVLSKTLESGNVIKIEGKAKMLPYSFLINLQSSELKWPHPNILLHINARYSYSQKKNKKNLLVLNSSLNNVWGIEKTLTNGCLPMPGSVFEIIITCKDDHFNVYIQEEVILDFPYNSSLQGVKVIYIQACDENMHSKYLLPVFNACFEIQMVVSFYREILSHGFYLYSLHVLSSYIIFKYVLLLSVMIVFMFLSTKNYAPSHEQNVRGEVYV